MCDVFLSTLVYFPFVIFLSSKFPFSKLPHCQSPKSGKTHKMIFKEKLEIRESHTQDHDGEAFYQTYSIIECI